MALVGFIAQLIDGSIGMAYGVSSTSFLLTLGLTPAIASASVHTSEVFTTLFSGVSHLKVGNVDKRLFRRLLIPGCVSAVIGAYLLVNIPLWFVKPSVSIYLAITGVAILLRAFGKNIFMKQVNINVLAFVGGFCDAVGGGGWGPVVTTTLIANGEDVKTTIGSVNLAEFFVTICASVSFFLLIGLNYPFLIIALIIGGVIASPLGALVCKKAPPKLLMLIVGVVIMVLSVKNLIGV